MRERLDELRDLEESLAAGRLEEGRALAFLIARPRGLPGLEEQRVTDSALAVAGSRTLEQARHHAPAISAACAGCHPFRVSAGAWR
jgi:hypothetical protein